MVVFTRDWKSRLIRPSPWLASPRGGEIALCRDSARCRRCRPARFAKRDFATEYQLFKSCRLN